MRVMLTLALLLSLVTLSACSSGGRSGGIPTEKPLVSGTITQQGQQGILVEEQPGQQSGDTKAWAQVGSKTAVYRQAGKEVQPATAADLKIGQKVSVWASGPVRESYPLQADAGTVLILGQ